MMGTSCAQAGSLDAQTGPHVLAGREMVLGFPMAGDGSLSLSPAGSKGHSWQFKFYLSSEHFVNANDCGSK